MDLNSLSKDPNYELVTSASFSGADINVYVMVSPSVLFQKQADLEKDIQLDSFELNPPVALGLINNDGVQYTPKTADKYIAKSDISTLQSNVNDHFVKLVDLQTISYSVFREKLQVKALGQPEAKGFTRGFITVAGTMIFTIMYEAVLNALFVNGFTDSRMDDLHGYRVDQLPPLDIFIVMANETGQLSKMGIWGLEFMNEGQAMSIQDLMTENSVTYVARDITRLQRVNNPYELNLADLKQVSNRMMFGPEEFTKASKQIKAQLQYFL